MSTFSGILKPAQSTLNLLNLLNVLKTKAKSRVKKKKKKALVTLSELEHNGVIKYNSLNTLNCLYDPNLAAFFSAYELNYSNEDFSATTDSIHKYRSI